MKEGKLHCKQKVLYTVIKDCLVNIKKMRCSEEEIDNIVSVLIDPIKKYCKSQRFSLCNSNCSYRIPIDLNEAEKIKQDLVADIKNQLTIITLSIDIINDSNSDGALIQCLNNIYKAAYTVSEKLDLYLYSTS